MFIPFLVLENMHNKEESLKSLLYGGFGGMENKGNFNVSSVGYFRMKTLGRKRIVSLLIFG